MNATAQKFEQSILIPPSRIGEFKHEMDKLVRKAHRYGNTDVGYEIGERTFKKETRRDAWGREYNVQIPFYPVTVSGEAPRVGQFELLARVELGSNGNIVDTVPGAEAPDEQYRFADGYCDHCSTRRRRKLVYIVRDEETGEQLQVGRQCLRDFLGIDTPELIAHKFSFLRLIADPSFSEGFGKPRYEEMIVNLLSVAATCVRLWGWAPARSCGGSTAGLVGLFLFPPPKPTKLDKEIIATIASEHNDDDKALAEKIIDWVRNELEANSDYAHNLKVLFANDMLTDGRRQSLVVSAIAAYHFAMDQKIKRQERKREAANSEFQGELKQRLRGIEAEITDQREVGENDFGPIVLIKFKDDQGNIYSWFTSKGSKLANGSKIKLDGTVKKHNEFRGAKETVLTRCRLHDV